MTMLTTLRPHDLRRENPFGVDRTLPVLILGAALLVLASVVFALVDANALMLIPGLVFFVLIVSTKMVDLTVEQIATEELSLR